MMGYQPATSPLWVSVSLFLKEREDVDLRICQMETQATYIEESSHSYSSVLFIHLPHEC